MGSKSLPIPAERLVALAREHGTPLFVYDAATIRARCAELAQRFEVVRYAQKANSNLAILAEVRAAGCQVDAVSAGELGRARAAGFAPEEIVFSADLFDRAALEALARTPVRVNLGSPDMLAQYAELGLAREVTLRVNPGFGAGHGARVTTGGEHSKHGIWHADLQAVVAQARTLGLEVTGLHVHVGSGASVEGLVRAAEAMRELAPRVGPSLAMISAGGGLPVPYRPGEARPDLDHLARAWGAVRSELESRLDRPIALEVEPGRYLVAEAGLLVTEVRATKRSGSTDFVLVDAGFHNLPRPVLYGAYHEVSLLGREPDEPNVPQVVAGPLCESSDVFFQDVDGRIEPRFLPRMRVGDFLCVHDAGAYAASMASSYNGQPLAAEVLLMGWETRLVARRQEAGELWCREPLPTRPWG